jgi:hypothetical protein
MERGRGREESKSYMVYVMIKMRRPPPPYIAAVASSWETRFSEPMPTPSSLH